MPGSVVDLSPGIVPLPDPIVVDTNILVERLLAAFLGALPTANAVQAQRANQFFLDLAARRGTGIVTPTIFTELVHIAIQFKYRQELLTRGNALRQMHGPLRDWKDLYKRDPTILQAYALDLELLRRLLIANDLLFIDPDELGATPFGRGHDEELVALVGTYGLDSNDASILLEAQRCGVNAIITLGGDLKRGQSDFDIYTWL